MTGAGRADPAEAYAGLGVLVTGGLGFIGSALARRLAAAGARVTVFDSLLPFGGGSPRNLVRCEGVEVVVEDTRSRDAVARAVADQAVIFHLAAPSGPAAFPVDWYTEIDVSCLGTLHVLESARLRSPGARVVFASSHLVYAPDAAAPVPESAPTEPRSLFGVHKLAGEKYCGLFGAAHGLDCVVARLWWVYGPRQRVSGLARGSVGHILESVLHGDEIWLDDDGRERIDLLHVDDAVDALLTLGRADRAAGAIVNVASGEARALREIAELAVRAAGAGSVRTEDAKYAPATSAGAGSCADVSRARALGVAPPRRSLEEGLQQTVAWFRGAARAL